MALPKEPRQLMINLMYLVLTAMLALNVTKEVLSAFATINDSIENSNATIIQKNTDFYERFEKAEAEDKRGKVKPWNDIAKEVKAESESMYKYLEGWKKTVIDESGGMETRDGVTTIKALDDINTPTRIFVEQKKGDEVKAKIQAFSNFLASKVPHNPALAKSLPVKITELKRTQDNPSGDWAFGTFHNIPVMATVAMFSKYQNDVKNAEAMVLEDLSSRVYLDDLKFDSLIAIATPNTTYALNGQEIEAQIVLGAFNKNTNPIMTSNAGAVTVKNGVGTLKIKASGTGKRPVSGTVTAEMNGEKMTFPYKFEYTVGTAGASLQLDKMQVMYIGVDNPITIAASGYNIEDVKPNMPWATLTPNGPGKYFAKVTTAGKYQFSIDASSRGGATGGKIQSGEIRVLPIPDPIASIGGKQGGLIPTNSAKAQSGVSAKLTEFVFETQFKVTSFRFTYLPKIGDPVSVEVKGNAFDAAAQQLIKRSNPSDRWLIENVRAIGPDNKVRTINTIILTLN